MTIQEKFATGLGRITRGRMGEAPPTVAVVRLAGVISSSSRRFRSGHLNIASLAHAFERAFSLPGLEAVAFVVNSPGGAPVQSALIHDRIRALAAEKQLPVFMFVEDVAASGGYWLACAGDEIFANENSIVGSIGVISAGFGFTDLMRKIGLERRTHAQGERKMMLDPFAPENPEDVERLEAIQKDIHQSFISLVKARRGDKLAKRKQKEIFSGEIWLGKRALDLGLVDGLGDLRGVMRQRYGEKVKLRVVGDSRGWLQRRFGLADSLSGSILPENWAGQLIDAVETRSLWSRFGL
jgi:serine protease SohB